ncbi:hypothetical protein CEXT_210021 [Caerostris extrusa]|uniref:Uncharacterized protein n=1 Tax=Caerostris extrusa TaxID=172846 RepID=A0AAV4R4H2_CAEEX|nr:hypothetical protein CEXT_210021 [Caerostris extrusa]
MESLLLDSSLTPRATSKTQDGSPEIPPVSLNRKLFREKGVNSLFGWPQGCCSGDVQIKCQSDFSTRFKSIDIAFNFSNRILRKPQTPCAIICPNLNLRKTRPCCINTPLSKLAWTIFPAIALPTNNYWPPKITSEVSLTGGVVAKKPSDSGTHRRGQPCPCSRSIPAKSWGSIVAGEVGEHPLCNSVGELSLESQAADMEWNHYYLTLP